MSQFPEDKSYLILMYARANREGYRAFKDGKAERDCRHVGALKLHWLAGFYASENDATS